MSYSGWNKSQIEQKWQLGVILSANSNWLHDMLYWGGFWEHAQGLAGKECVIN